MADAEMQDGAGEAQPLEVSDFETLLQDNFVPRTDEAKTAIQDAVGALVENLVDRDDLVQGDAVKCIQGIIDELDRKLSEQVNAIMHSEDFKKLEGAWRGLHFLVNNTDTGSDLKIRVFNISKRELGKTLKKFKGAAWDQSPIFKKVYTAEYDQAGGSPYGALVGDFAFNQTAPDVEILGEMSKVAAAAHAPFIAGADPLVMGMDSWQELGDPRQLEKRFESPEYAPWRALRKSDDSKYLGLAMPRFMARVPYGPDTNPVDEFNFVEETGKGDHEKFVWANAAYAMARNITRSFKDYGWCARIRGKESGGIVEDLPAYTYKTESGETVMKCPTEIQISDRRENELSDLGFLPLIHWKDENYAAFIGGNSLHDPAEYDDADATANARLGAKLPYLFATTRFAHFLKCMVRDKIGSFKERDDMQTWLQNWIMGYVTTDKKASEETKAQFPLAEAEVVVDEVEGNPGWYSAKFYLRPHYQLEGLKGSLRLVSKLPSQKQGG